jgi:hypothetical protein
MLTIATQVTEVHVGLTPDELANVQIKEQEKQRVLGFIPNFYVSYVPNAAPLSPKHKFELAWKSASDPVTFVAVGVVAGLDQAGDRWGAYGQGAQGYAKRFGASYADVFVGTFIGSAALPSLLKQDPRYFYKGSGTKRSRILYALASSLRCKGDNGRWQANYSSILGNLAAGGISNFYYPANDRNGVGTDQNWRNRCRQYLPRVYCPEVDTESSDSRPSPALKHFASQGPGASHRASGLAYRSINAAVSVQVGRGTCGWRIVISPMIPYDSPSCYHSGMRHPAVLFTP